MMQSSTAHQWPYPAYLYGKASWAAVDILYFLPDIPITFMGEVDGEVMRIGQTHVYQTEKKDVKSGTGMKKSGSQLMLALAADENTEDPADRGETKKDTGLGVRVSSGSNLNAMAI